jgi:large repetitive protein
LAGRHPITGVYGGDSNFTGSTSTILSQTVNQATPIITWANPVAITYGTPLSALQLNATASVGGTFAYLPVIGTVLPVGSQTLNVTFTPTDIGDYNTQTASTTITVTRVPATLGITSTVNPSIFGNTITLGFTLTGVAGYAIPSGVVAVTDGVSPLTTLTLDGTGKAAYTTSSFVVGVHPLTAVYGGDINYR